MKINSIRLKNFRGFEDRTFEFNDHFNVVIGNNATGKTALLDALALSMSSFFLGIDGYNSRTISDTDIRIKTFDENLEKQFPVEVEANGIVKGRQLNWMRDRTSLGGKTRKSGDTIVLEKMARQSQDLVREKNEEVLPVLAYYGTGRLWKEKKSTINTKPKSTRFDGYIHSTEPYSNSKTFLEWIKTQEIAVLQRKKDPVLLEAVKRTVSQFLDATSSVYFDVILDTLIFEYTDKDFNIHHLPWTMLSDGYRNIVAMAADLAYRCVTLNPVYGPEAASKAEGVVLIDEIDLHLHPKWQRKIVEQFKYAFPNLQFITTTHSPFIVQSLKNEELINLDGEYLETDYFRKSVEDIAEVMGIEDVQRSDKFKAMMDAADAYYKAIDEGRTSETDSAVKVMKEKLDVLSIPFTDDPAFAQLLKLDAENKMIK